MRLIPKPKGTPGKGARNGRNGYNIYDAMELERGNKVLKAQYNELGVHFFISSNDLSDITTAMGAQTSTSGHIRQVL